MQHFALITLTGDLTAESFPAWILRHAHKLGVIVEFQTQAQDHMTLKAQGAKEMVEALALACSLGPHCVLIKDMTCTFHTPLNRETA